MLVEIPKNKFRREYFLGFLSSGRFIFMLDAREESQSDGPTAPNPALLSLLNGETERRIPPAVCTARAGPGLHTSHSGIAT